MRNVLTKRQRERVVQRWVETELAAQALMTPGGVRAKDSAAYNRLMGITQGMNDALEAILIDRQRGADWTEFNQIADEITARVEVQRISRAPKPATPRMTIDHCPACGERHPIPVTDDMPERDRDTAASWQRFATRMLGDDTTDADLGQLAETQAWVAERTA